MANEESKKMNVTAKQLMQRYKASIARSVKFKAK